MAPREARVGLRGRLFLLAVGLTALVLVPGAFFLEHELRAELDARIDAELYAHAAAAGVAVEAATDATLPGLAAALGRASGRRHTIVAADGRVLADSEIAPAELAAVENHGHRPEIERAIRDGRGLAQRRSGTLATELRYAAIALPDGRIVRVAQSVDEIGAAVGQLRRYVALAGLLTLAVGIVVAAVASQLVAGSLRDLVATTRGLAAPATPDGPRRRVDDVVRGGDAAGELERTFKLLAQQRERLRAVLEGMGDAVVAIDPAQTITLLNPAAGELLGVGDDAVGRALVEVIRAPALLDLLGDGATTRTAEFDLPGTTRRVLVTVTPERADGGHVLVLHDVTTIRRLETMRRDFVANVSHELRTPISIVSANAETLRLGALEDREAAPALVAAIERNAERLRRLIDDLLDLSRIEAGRYQMTLAPVEPRAIARRAADALAGPAGARGTRIELELDDAPQVLADEGALHQVLVNLLDNAIKYTQDGGRIVVGARRDGERVRIEVRDDGPGIAPSDRERVFERFYRVDPGRSRDIGGTGLGLAIVKHLLDAMDGKVGISPNHPRGTIAWFELRAA
jgi:two-component system phosphate regulon sensor histidine kinase PhoR